MTGVSEVTPAYRRTGSFPWRGAAVVGVPAALMTVMGLVTAARLPLWRDEMATLSFASLHFPAMWQALSHVDAVMGPYYTLAFVTQQIAQGAFSLRVPSVLAAVGSTIVVAILARRWWGDLPGFVAGIALGVNPLLVTMAATARPYALATFFVLLAANFLDCAVRTSRTEAWAAYGLATGLATLSHLFAATTVFAFLFLALRSGRTILTWALVTAAGALMALPTALVAFTQRAQVAWIPRPNAKYALGSIASVIDYRAEGAITVWNTVGMVALAVVSITVLISAIRLPPPERRTQVGYAVFSVSLFVLPWMFLLAASLVATPYLRTTYLAPTTSGIALILAATVACGFRIRSHGAARAATTLLLTAAAIPFVVQIVSSILVLAAPWRVDNFPGLAERLAQVTRPGDQLVVMQPYNELGVAAAVARGTDDRHYLEELQHQLPFGTQPVEQLRVIESSEPFRTTAGVAADGVIWLVYTRGVLSDETFAMLAKDRLGCRGSASMVDTESFGLMRLSQGVCD